MTTCSRMQTLLGPYVDQELEPGDIAAVEAHVESCPSCAARITEIEGLDARLREIGPHGLPAGLADRVFARVHDEAEKAEAEKAESIQAQARNHRQDSPRSYWGGWLRQAAAIILAGGLSALAASSFWAWNDSKTSLERDILQAHTRALLQDNPVQIASSDNHQVQPWFAGRLGVAPVVKDIQGFTLIGGRMDLVGSHRAATIVYKRNAHIVNVFAWAADEQESAPRQLAMNGYNCVAWTRQGVYYWAVSDLAAAVLMELAQM